MRNQNRLDAYFDSEGNILDRNAYNQALEHCKTYEDLINSGKTDADIINSSPKANPAMAACTGLYDDYFHTYK